LIHFKTGINKRMAANISSAQRNPQAAVVITHPPPPDPLLLLLGQKATSPFEDIMLEKSLSFPAVS
jgi:hypothetical protein